MQQQMFDRLQQAERERFRALAEFQLEQFGAIREELDQLVELRQELDELRGELKAQGSHALGAGLIGRRAAALPPPAGVRGPRRPPQSSPGQARRPSSPPTCCGSRSARHPERRGSIRGDRLTRGPRPPRGRSPRAGRRARTSRSDATSVPPGVAPGLGGGGPGRFGEERQGGVGPGGEVGDGAIDGRGAADLAEDGQVAGQQRCAAGQGLGDRQAEPFGVARLKHQRGPAVDGRERQDRGRAERQRRRRSRRADAQVARPDAPERW